MTGLVPAIHVFMVAILLDGDVLRNSCLRELRLEISSRKSGKPDLQ